MLSVIMICVVFAILFWFPRKKNKNAPLVLSRRLPIIGHMHLLLGNSTKFWSFLKDLCYEIQKENLTCTVHLGPMKVYYVISKPDDYLTVANTCLQKDEFYEFVKPLAGEGLATAKVPIWKVHRKLLNPAFNQVVLGGFLDEFNKQARRLVDDLEIEIGKSSFDHYTYTKHYSLETFCLTALGVDLKDKSELYSQYIMAVEGVSNLLVERLQRPWLHNNFIFNWSTLKKKLDEKSKIVNAMSETVLQKAKGNYLMNKNRKVENTQGSKKTLMYLLNELSLEKGLLNDREIRDETNTMIAGGYETSATTLMFCILMIGSYPKVQEKIVEELNEVCGDDDRDITKSDLSRLIYLEAVIKETLRIYPIAPIVTRELDKDLELSDCTLSKGSACLLFIYGVHHSTIWGPDVEEFKPERWLDPASLPKSATAFVAFSAGKRNCIGKGYAIMFLKTTLAHIFRNYKVKGDHTKMELKFDVTLRPVSGYDISIQRRNSKNCV